MTFSHLPDILQTLGIKEVDGLLFDLGVSTVHFQEAKRGFSFLLDGPLDMRMDTRKTMTAFDIVNHFPLKEIEKIIRRYGEERWARRIAAAIDRERQHGEITTTGALAEIVARAIPQRYHTTRVHPATKTFQALRIAVNEELKEIEEALAVAPFLLKTRGKDSALYPFIHWKTGSSKRVLNGWRGRVSAPLPFRSASAEVGNAS